MNGFYAGAGLAAAAGLLMGAAMKPDLGLDDRAAGPQMVEPYAGMARSGPFDDGGAAYLAAYKGKVPDYVLGTDWNRTMTWTEPKVALPEPPKLRDDPPADMDDGAQPVEVTRADYADDQRAVSYPSVDGGQPAGMALLPAPG